MDMYRFPWHNQDITSQLKKNLKVGKDNEKRKKGSKIIKGQKRATENFK